MANRNPSGALVLAPKYQFCGGSSPTRKIISRNGFNDRNDASIEIETDPSGSFTAKTCSNKLTERPHLRVCSQARGCCNDVLS